MMVVTLSAVALLGVGVAAQNTNYTQDEKWQAPAQASEKQNPLPASEDLAHGGKKLFQRNCAECHGDDGAGLKKAADLQLPVVQSQSDGALFWKITNGNPRRGMPAFSRLPEAQRWQLVMYLRTLNAPEKK